MKLGYTFYPKDWGNSDAVFELGLAERGLYRELIDLAMLNDNVVKIKADIWARKFCSEINEIESILNKLVDLELIEINENVMFISSCEPRLNLSRGGKKGGEKSRKNKPTTKPIHKPIHKPSSNQTKGKETKGKENEGNIPPYNEFLEYALLKKPDVDSLSVKLKYDSWVELGWKTGMDKKIKNWKSTLLNTLPHLKINVKQAVPTNTVAIDTSGKSEKEKQAEIDQIKEAYKNQTKDENQV